MPSSQKTPFLRLNQWLGIDKPKKDDFNQDNLAVEEAMRLVNGSVERIDSQLTADKESTAHSFSQLEGKWSTANSALNAHAGNVAAHISAAERLAWNSGAVTIGTYKGNGSARQKIVLGYQPTLGLIYPADAGPMEADWNAEYVKIHFGFFGKAGCGQNLMLDSDGFSVLHTTAIPSNGYAFTYNTNNLTYVYVVWK